MMKDLQSRHLLKDFDWLLLAAAMLLSVISIVEIYSATIAQGASAYSLRQLAWVLVGIVLMFIVSAIDYRLISEHIPWLYMLGLGTLVYVKLLGHSVAGSKSWLGFGAFAFQPSEFIKMIVVVALARYLSELRSTKYMTFPQILKAGVIVFIPMGLILLQPDLGTALTYLPVIAVGLFVRGIRPIALVSLILGFVLILPVAWTVVLKPYQKERILTFMDPERDQLGKGYQVYQSKIAIGSGGLLGKGVFHGSQNTLGFLPTRHTDFIFSVVGEELGFVGVITALGLLSFIIFRSIYNAQTARDNLGLFIVMGVVGIFFFHVLVNVGMVIGFMPTTGIPLPFMSYGGSSVLTAYIALGLVMSVRRCRYVN